MVMEVAVFVGALGEDKKLMESSKKKKKEHILNVPFSFHSFLLENFKNKKFYKKLF